MEVEITSGKARAYVFFRRVCDEALPGGGPRSLVGILKCFVSQVAQVACRNFKMLRVGVLSRLTSLSEIKGQLLQFFVANSRL